MYRLTNVRFQSSSSLFTESEQSASLLINRIRQNRRKNRPKGAPGFFNFRAITASRLQGYVVAGGILLGAGIVLGPWLIHEYKEFLGMHWTPLDPSHMPALSCDWWESEWRKMNPVWRRGESEEGFYEGPFNFIEEKTGRDVHSADTFRATHPSSTVQTASSTSPPPRVLIPLCGDTPLLRHMAMMGYQVDGVDSSQTAMRAAVERTERGLPRELFPRVRLHWSDFFSPELWETGGPLHGPQQEEARHAKGSAKNIPPYPTYDIIYERQGLTAIPLSQRADYAHLLQRALKPDGLLYVEGIFRTGRVANNKLAGPPFGLSRRELKTLFPESTVTTTGKSSKGFHVVCEEKNDALAQLSREDRVLRRVPKELYVTPFHCVVFRDEAVNNERMKILLAREKDQVSNESQKKSGEMLHL